MSQPDGPWEPPAVLVAVDLVIFTIRDNDFQVLLIERGIDPYKGYRALPGGFLNHAREGVYEAALRELQEEANLDGRALHMEQLGAYGEPDRDPRGRVLSVAYLAIAPGLPEPIAGTDASDAGWTPVREVLSGHARLAFDHRRIFDDAVERSRAKLENSPLAAAFCAASFTIAQLRQVYEAVWGVDLDERNFYRKVQRVAGFIEPVGSAQRASKGRPARLFRAGPATSLQPPLTRPEQSVVPGDDL